MDSCWCTRQLYGDVHGWLANVAVCVVRQSVVCAMGVEAGCWKYCRIVLGRLFDADEFVRLTERSACLEGLCQ